MQNVLFIAVSQSGASPDLVQALNQAKVTGALTLAVTNDSSSPLAQSAHIHLCMGAGPEQAVAATKTYTAQLLTLYLLLDAWTGGDGEAANDLPDHARSILALQGDVSSVAGRYRFARDMVVTSRGYNYPTAREAALKLMETSYVVAHAFSGADLLHGPMAMIHTGFPVIAIVVTGPGGDALAPVLKQLRDKGADTLVVGDRDAASAGTVGLALPNCGPEITSPILMILPLQMLAWELAMQRGFDPDRPRGLQKITETW